jgi:hypothetical protein
MHAAPFMHLPAPQPPFTRPAPPPGAVLVTSSIMHVPHASAQPMHVPHGATQYIASLPVGPQAMAGNAARPVTHTVIPLRPVAMAREARAAGRAALDASAADAPTAPVAGAGCAAPQDAGSEMLRALSTLVLCMNAAHALRARGHDSTHTVPTSADAENGELMRMWHEWHVLSQDVAEVGRIGKWQLKEVLPCTEPGV